MIIVTDGGWSLISYVPCLWTKPANNGNFITSENRKFNTQSWCIFKFLVRNVPSGDDISYVIFKSVNDLKKNSLCDFNLGHQVISGLGITELSHNLDARSKTGVCVCVCVPERSERPNHPPMSPIDLLLSVSWFLESRCRRSEADVVESKTVLAEMSHM